MNLVVKKFGGTSVGDVPRIKNVARLIQSHLTKNPNDKIVVVVSAMAGETNKLVALAKGCVEKPEPREMDVLLATGEQVTIALLSMALIELGLPAKSLIGQQAKISTNQRHTNAQILDIDASAVQKILDEGKIPVVAGFQGVDPDGDVTTLGRGGSDITAVAVAVALKASACYIYTDVEGVYSTDPRICKNARMLKRVCHEEMLEMASLGAKVLHPRSVYFAMRYQMPLVVLSTFAPGEGTWIVKEEELMEKPVVTGITYRTDESKISISALKGGINALNSLFENLAKEDIFVDMITQAGAEEGITNISFTIPDEASAKAQEIAQSVASRFGAKEVGINKDVSKVSIVGIGMRYHTGVAARLFSLLASEGIDVQMISTSDIKVSILIPRKYCEVAVRVLHEGFVGISDLDSRPEVSIER